MNVRSVIQLYERGDGKHDTLNGNSLRKTSRVVVKVIFFAYKKKMPGSMVIPIYSRATSTFSIDALVGELNMVIDTVLMVYQERYPGYK